MARTWSVPAEEWVSTRRTLGGAHRVIAEYTKVLVFVMTETILFLVADDQRQSAELFVKVDKFETNEGDDQSVSDDTRHDFSPSLR